MQSSHEIDDLKSQLKLSGPRRRRIRKACEPCRQRKVKCDGRHPCKVCCGYGYDCNYAIGDRLSVGIESSTPSRTNQHVSRPHDQPFKDSVGFEASDDAQHKVLYVLSDDHQSMKNLNTSFTRVDSAIAFPRTLGISLNLINPPKIHSFAWNTGTRALSIPPPRAKVFDYVSLRDVETFSKVYFSVVHPIFGILDRTAFERQAMWCWSTQDLDTGFEAVVCGVLTLGSLFSTKGPLQHESELVEQARLALDSTFAHPKVLLSVDLVAGWILRAIYLRGVTRPHLSWMASCMAMHIAESIGLHQEISDICIKPTQNPNRFVGEAEVEIRRRTFWVASSLNRLFACHFGRTRIMLPNVGCQYPTPKADDMTTDFIDLTRCVVHDVPQASITSSSDLVDGLEKLSEFPVKALPLLLIRAEICFCVYRKLRYLGIAPSPSQVEMFLSITRSALVAANLLSQELQQWWSIIGVPFHSLCILVAINSLESLSLLPEAMETLTNVATIFNTQHSCEAVQTAHYLVRGAEAKKRKEMDCLQRCLSFKPRTAASQVLPLADVSPEEIMMSDVPSFEWPTDLELGWSEFLDLTTIDGSTRMAGDLTQQIC